MENAKNSEEIFEALQDLQREVQGLKRKFYLDRVGGENNPCCEVFLTEKRYCHPSRLTLDTSSACNSSAESGQVRDEPAKKANPKLAIGQVWRMRNGQEVEIVDFLPEETNFPWVSSKKLSYTHNGSSYPYMRSEYDLMVLISDTKPSIPKPLTKEPLMGRTYYTLSPGLSHSVWYEWCDTVADKAIFDNGLAFETGKEASEAAKFMLQAWKQALKDSEN